MPVFTPFAHYTEPQAAQILRRHMGGQKNFLSLIFQSSALLLTFVASLIQLFETQAALNDTLYMANYPYASVSSASVGYLVGSIIGLVIGTAVGSLGLVALWMIFASARSQKSPMGTAGFTMQKILAIIAMSLVGVYILFVILLFSFFSVILDLVLAVMAGSEAVAMVNFLGGFAMVIIVIVFIFAFGYSLAVSVTSLITANRMKATARTGLPGKPIPMFFIVALFLDIAACCFSMLITIPTLVMSFSFGSLLMLLAYIPTVVSGVLRAMVLLGYRRELRELQNFTPSNAPVPPPAAPVAPMAPVSPTPAADWLRPYTAEERLQPQAGTKVCRYCGTANTMGAPACVRCGRPL